MSISRIAFQPVCEGNDSRVNPKDASHFGPLPKDVNILIISRLGLKALGSLCCTSVKWNHLVAHDFIWRIIAEKIGCPLQEGIPFYRQVVSFVVNFREKLIFIDRSAYLLGDFMLFSVLQCITKADLDRVNEELPEAEAAQNTKRLKLESPQNEDKTDHPLTLKGLTIDQVRFLQTLSRARDVMQIYLEKARAERFVNNLPIPKLENVQDLLEQAKEKSDWLAKQGEFIFCDGYVEEIPPELGNVYFDGNDDFSWLRSSEYRRAEIVKQFLRHSHIPSPVWIEEYEDIRNLTVDCQADPDRLIRFKQLEKLFFVGVDDDDLAFDIDKELMAALDDLPKLRAVRFDEGEVSDWNSIEFPRINNLSKCLQHLEIHAGIEQIPKEVWKLTNLQSLVIDPREGISGLSEEISALTQLKRLQINKLRKFHEVLFNLTKLESLDLSFN